LSLVAIAEILSWRNYYDVVTDGAVHTADSLGGMSGYYVDGYDRMSGAVTPDYYSVVNVHTADSRCGCDLRSIIVWWNEWVLENYYVDVMIE
jgi:hypothetical protein